jgi:hypothetical protein
VEGRDTKSERPDPAAGDGVNGERPGPAPAAPPADHAPPPAGEEAPPQAPPVALASPASGFHFTLTPSAPVAPPVSAPAREPLLVPLEERIRRLEDALAQLQDVQEGEKVSAGPPPGAVQRDPPAPGSAGVAGGLLGAAGRLLGSAPVQASARAARRAWLFWEALAEARAVFRMYADPRYRLSWTGRAVVPVLLVAFLTTGFWVPLSGVWVVGWVVERAVQLVVGFGLFKALGYEARRYRETSPDLPPSLRL